MSDTQPATADAGQDVAKPTPDAASEPTLKEMLEQFDKQAPQQKSSQSDDRAAPQSTAPAPKGSDDNAELIEWVRQKQEQEARDTTDKAVKDASSFLREADPVLADIPDRIAEGLLYAEANRNPDFAKAFALRHQSPAVWERALSDLAKSTASELGPKPDAKLTADREAARASIRGTSQTAPDPDEADSELARKISEMGRREFAEYKANLARKS